jgi:hypothetical protein
MKHARAEPLDTSSFISRFAGACGGAAASSACRKYPKPQLSYFTGKLARVRATARALSSVSNRDCTCARCERAASLRNALMRSCLIWMSLQGERARRNRVFASRRRASRGSCVAFRTPSSRSSFHTSSKSREKRARASGVKECRSRLEVGRTSGVNECRSRLEVCMIFFMLPQPAD